MTRTRVAVVSLSVLAIVIILMFPPFMVIDRATPNTRHSGLGHHPVWNPPTEAAAEELLSQDFGPPPPGVGSALDIRQNSVLLTVEIVVILLSASAAWLFLGRGAPSHNGQKGTREN